MFQTATHFYERVQIQPARKEEAREVASLFRLSSDGMADYIWSKLAEPGEDMLDVGARRYARENTNFSYQNCQLARVDGEVAGMLHAFPMHVDPDYVEQDPVLKPANELEEDNSYYVSGVAVFEQYRGHGLGRLLMDKAEVDCDRAGLKRISLLVFDQNLIARHMYDRLGYEVIDRRTVVAHPLIHFTGEVLLMSKRVADTENRN